VLPAVRVPTLVLHRVGDLAIPVEKGRYLAEHIAGATRVELEGTDHLPVLGDIDAMTDSIVAFLQDIGGDAEPDSVLATVLAIDLAVSASARGSDPKLLQDIVRKEVTQFRGRLISGDGDAAIATFDGPTRALFSAVGIRNAARALGLPARLGLHTGEVQFRGSDVFGKTLTVSTEIARQAEPGEVLASNTVVDLVAGSGLAFQDRGTASPANTGHQLRLVSVSSA
jgi:class 3 adenylate cyclase